MKKVVILIIVITSIILTINIHNTPKLKTEYEMLNNKKYIKVTIPNDSSLKYSNHKEITKILNETGVIYIGSAKSQISRDNLNQLIKASNDTSIKTIYYLDFKDNKKEKKKLEKQLNKKIYIPTLITVKNGEIKKIISEKKEITNEKYQTSKDKKKKILKEYTEAINEIIMCSSETKDQC